VEVGSSGRFKNQCIENECGCGKCSLTPHGGVGQHAPRLCLMNVSSIWQTVHIISVTVIWNLQHEDCNHNVPQMAKLKTGYCIAYIINLLHIKATEWCPWNSVSSCNGGVLIVDICTTCRASFCSRSRAAMTWHLSKQCFPSYFPSHTLLQRKITDFKMNWRMLTDAQNVWNDTQNWTKVFKLQLMWIGFLRVEFYGSCLWTLWRTFGFRGRVVLFGE